MKVPPPISRRHFEDRCRSFDTLFVSTQFLRAAPVFARRPKSLVPLPQAVLIQHLDADSTNPPMVHLTGLQLARSKR